MVNLEIMRAINLASRLYDGLKREGSGLPHFSHVFNVFLIVREYSDDTDVQVAALFHDFFKRSIPKQGMKDPNASYDYSDLVSFIGIPAARLVDELSCYRDPNTGQEMEWRSSKYRALENFAKLSHGAKIVFTANQIHNLFSLVEDYKNTKTKIWELFGASEDQMAIYYSDIMETFACYFHYPLISDYYQIFREACQLFGWPDQYQRGVRNLIWAGSLSGD